MACAAHEDDHDTRAALRAAMWRWRTSITLHRQVGAAWLPDKWPFTAWEITAWESATDQIVWVQFSGNLDAAVFVRELEDVELLVLLSQVDFALWQELMRDLWPEDVAWAAFFTSRTALRVGVELRGEGLDYEYVRRLCDYMAASQENGSRSEGYYELRRLMARVLGVAPHALPVVPVRINDLDLSARRLLVKLRDARTRTTPRDTIESSSLRITQLLNEFYSVEGTYEEVEALVSIRTLGIQVIDLPMYDVPADGHAIEAFPLAVGALLLADPPLPPVSPSPPDELARGLECITIMNTLADEFVPGVFSAINASRTLRGVTLGFEERGDTRCEAMRQRTAWWTAYALFHREPLGFLGVLASKLTMQDVRWMWPMLTARNPMTLLFPDDVDRQWPRVAVPAHGVLLYDPHDTTIVSRPTSHVLAPAHALEVLGECYGGFVPVLLPGWGKAWAPVETTAITPVGEAYRPLPTSPTHLRIERMTTAASMDAALALLRLIGRDVKHLAIFTDSCPNVVMDAFCSHALAACPRLEAIELGHMELTSFQFLLDALTGSHRASLTKVTLCTVQVEDDSAVNELLAALAQPRNPVASQLRMLRLELSRCIDRPTLDAALRMLSRNTKLREVRLIFQTDVELVATYKDLFKPFALSYVTDPLPQSSMLAFLSVTTRLEATSQSGPWPAAPRLDSSSISHIFAFAATRFIRSAEFYALKA